MKCRKLIKRQSGSAERRELLPFFRRRDGVMKEEYEGVGPGGVSSALISILSGRRLYCNLEDQFERKRPCSPKHRFINLPPPLARSLPPSLPPSLAPSVCLIILSVCAAPPSCTSHLNASTLDVGVDSLCGLVYTADTTPCASLVFKVRQPPGTFHSITSPSLRRTAARRFACETIYN